jgi:hypothetical protein
MKNNRQKIQILWGVALVLMGVALLFEIPYKIEQYQKFVNPFVHFCLYFIAAALIFAGGKKIVKFRKTGDI